MRALERYSLDGRALLVCLLLAMAVLAVYWQVRTHEFVDYDDLEYIVDNPHVSDGLSADNIGWALTETHSANWHPLTWISHMIDCELFGVDPAGHHLVNVFLHALNSALLFLALRAMTGAFWRCAIVAALFALHPMRVESVAWAAERKDLLCALFWLLAMLAYVFYSARPSIGRYLLVAGAFVLGLLSKAMIVTLPCALLLLDFWPLRRSEPIRRLLLEKTPLLAISVLAGLITMLSQKAAGAFYAIPFGYRLANGALAYIVYIWKTIFPAKLAVFYPHPMDLHAAGDHRWLWLAAGAALLTVSLTLFACRQRRRRPYLLVGWLWYLGTLLPVLGLLQVGRQALADRYSYLPLIGLQVAVVWALAELAKHRRAAGAILNASAALLIVLFAFLSWMQVGHWKNSVTLYEHALLVTRSNALAHYNLGTTLFRSGKTEEALSHFEAAVRIIPKFADAHANLGAARFKVGDLSRAEEHLARALSLRPDHAEAHYNYGRLRMSGGELGRARRHFEEALRADPDHVESHTNLGVLCAMSGELSCAEAQFRKALGIDPDHLSALMNLGRLLTEKGDLRGAEECFERARELR